MKSSKSVAAKVCIMATRPGTSSPGSYLVLASQRSGSTLLVESLRATGLAGNPAEFFQCLPSTSLAPQPREWFADVTDPEVLALLDRLDPGSPITETRAVAGPDPGSGPQAPTASGAANSCGIRLRCSSIGRAAGIAHLVSELLRQAAGGRKWFADNDIAPFEVNYDELTADTIKVVAAILEALCLDPTAARTGETGRRPLERVGPALPRRARSPPHRGVGARGDRQRPEPWSL